MTSSSLARSVTVRAIGPIWPVGDGYPPHTPDLVTRPGVGRMPTMLFHVLGRRIEANPSCPIATVPKVRADTGSRTAGRPTHRALEVVWVACGSKQRPVGIAAAPFAQRHLGQNDGARLLHFRDSARIQRRHVVFHHQRAERRRHSRHVDLVLDQDDECRAAVPSRFPVLLNSASTRSASSSAFGLMVITELIIGPFLS